MSKRDSQLSNLSLDLHIGDLSVYKTPLAALKGEDDNYGIHHCSSFRGDAIPLSNTRKGSKLHSYVKPKTKSTPRKLSKKLSSKGGRAVASFRFKKAKEFPKVYVRNPKTGVCNYSPIRFGTDVFSKAGIKRGRHPELVLEELGDGSVVIRALSTKVEEEKRIIEERMYFERKKRKESKKSLELIEAEELNNFLLEPTEYTLPAGAFTMRSDALGFVSRMLINASPLFPLKKSTTMRVAAVVLPVVKFHRTNRRYLMITQRQTRKNGVYNNLWVFPGGHVDMNESLKEAAVREVGEETGLNIKQRQLQALCCWQEFNIPKQVQYLITVFFCELEIEVQMTEVEFIATVGIQFKEVKSCAMMPEATWPSLAHQDYTNFRLKKKKHVDVEKVLGVKAVGEEIEATDIDVAEIYGKNSFQGIGTPHRYAVGCFLQREEDIELERKVKIF